MPERPDDAATPCGGPYLDDLAVGAVLHHRATRTVAEADDAAFTEMIPNPRPVRVRRHVRAAGTDGERPPVNALFTLALMIGISAIDTTSGTALPDLGMTDVRFPTPLRAGDTVSCTTEVLSVRPSRSRPEAGIVEFLHRAYNGRDELVAECRRRAFVRRRPGEVGRAENGAVEEEGAGFGLDGTGPGDA